MLIEFFQSPVLDLQPNYFLVFKADKTHFWRPFELGKFGWIGRFKKKKKENKLRQLCGMCYIYIDTDLSSSSFFFFF